MKRFNINGQSVLLFEDQLWIPVIPEATIHAPEVIKEAEAILDKGLAKVERIKKRRGRKPRFDQSSDQTDAIKSDLRAGEKPGALAVRYNVPAQTIYNIKLRMKADGEELPDLRKSMTEIKENKSEIHQYQCVSNHRFNSNLKQSEAKCPSCGAKVFREIKDGSTI